MEAAGQADPSDRNEGNERAFFARFRRPFAILLGTGPGRRRDQGGEEPAAIRRPGCRTGRGHGRCGPAYRGDAFGGRAKKQNAPASRGASASRARVRQVRKRVSPRSSMMLAIDERSGTIRGLKGLVLQVAVLWHLV